LSQTDPAQTSESGLFKPDPVLITELRDIVAIRHIYPTFKGQPQITDIERITTSRSNGLLICIQIFDSPQY